MTGRVSICLICGAAVTSTGARGRLSLLCSPACKAEHVRRRLRAWRAGNPDRNAAYNARKRAGRALFVEVTCVVCGQQTAQPRKPAGRHKRTCSEACSREQDRRRRQRNNQSSEQGGGG